MSRRRLLKHVVPEMSLMLSAGLMILELSVRRSGRGRWRGSWASSRHLVRGYYVWSDPSRSAMILCFRGTWHWSCVFGHSGRIITVLLSACTCPGCLEYLFHFVVSHGPSGQGFFPRSVLHLQAIASRNINPERRPVMFHIQDVKGSHDVFCHDIPFSGMMLVRCSSQF